MDFLMTLILASLLLFAPQDIPPPPSPVASQVDVAGGSISEVNDPVEAFDLLTLAVDAFRKKRYGVFTGMLLMLLVFGMRKVKALRNLPKEWSPWIACGLGIIFSIGTVLAADRPPITAITHGFVLGAAATGLWEMVGKHLLRR